MRKCPGNLPKPPRRGHQKKMQSQCEASEGDQGAD